MGLDQYFYRCFKVDSDFEKNYLQDPFVSYEKSIKLLEDYTVLSAAEIADSPCLKNVATPVKMECKYTDLKKLFQDQFPGKNFDDYDHSGTAYGETVSFSFSSIDGNDHLETTELTDKELEKFSFKQIEDVYVFREAELAYFRKAYFIQQWLRHIGWNYSGNCIYKEIPSLVLDYLIDDLKELCSAIGGTIPNDLEEKFHVKYFEEERFPLEKKHIADCIMQLRSVQNYLDSHIGDDVICYYEWY